MDAAIGRVIEAQRAAGPLDNTVMVFLSDNGGCAEEMPPGHVDGLAGRRTWRP